MLCAKAQKQLFKFLPWQFSVLVNRMSHPCISSRGSSVVLLFQSGLWPCQLVIKGGTSETKQKPSAGLVCRKSAAEVCMCTTDCPVNTPTRESRERAQ